MRFAALNALPLLACAMLVGPALAQQTRPAAQPASIAVPPKLIVVISVDQFSADLFAEYRDKFSGGFKRLLTGAVFPSGYQSHAATETCPGHSTILTGDHPARTGIVANTWIDLKTARNDTSIYCAEDESVPGSTSDAYTVSDKHLLVPTLGERMKAANPAVRTVSVAGKDRAAVMMGGHRVDELWWWDGKTFTSYAGRAEPGAVTRGKAAIAARIAAVQPPLAMDPRCAEYARPIQVKDGLVVGSGAFARAAGDAKSFRASPEFDAGILAIAAALIEDMQLGKGAATDIISIGASATDYVGHGYGTEGSEMCLQLMALDASLDGFFGVLDRAGIDYAVALTADHGGLDLPERARMQGIPEAQRVGVDFEARLLADLAAAKIAAPKDAIRINGGDVYIDPGLPAAERARLTAGLVAAAKRQPQVQTAFTRAEIEATTMPKGPPETWSIAERIRASYYAPRSGDVYIALKPRVTAIAEPGPGYVATHGSVWDYDRRVPILFWRKNMAGFEQPMGVETVDIAPTLAALIGLPIAPGEMDGRCLDLDPGAATSCR